MGSADVMLMAETVLTSTLLFAHNLLDDGASPQLPQFNSAAHTALKLYLLVISFQLRTVIFILFLFFLSLKGYVCARTPKHTAEKLSCHLHPPTSQSEQKK